MKNYNLIKAASVLALAAASALPAGNASGAAYSTGDLLLGFVATSGQGVDETLVVNLGPASAFRDGFDSGASQINFKNIGAQLSAQFSATWYDRTDLRINLFGATAPDTVGDDLISLDPFQTVYVSRSRLLPTGNTAPQNVATATAMTTATSRIGVTSNVYAASTADGVGVSIIPDSLPNTLDEFTRPSVSASFGTFSSGIDQIFTAGSWGNYPNVGAVEAALDLYRIQGRNDAPGQYGEGDAVRAGTYKGTFTISNTGDISFVPEPGSTAILGLTGLLALARRRRA